MKLVVKEVWPNHPPRPLQLSIRKLSNFVKPLTHVPSKSIGPTLSSKYIKSIRIFLCNVNMLDDPKSPMIVMDYPKSLVIMDYPENPPKIIAIKLDPKSPTIVKDYTSPTIYSNTDWDDPKILKHIHIRLIKVRHRELQRIVSANTR